MVQLNTDQVRLPGYNSVNYDDVGMSTPEGSDETKELERLGNLVGRDTLESAVKTNTAQTFPSSDDGMAIGEMDNPRLEPFQLLDENGQPIDPFDTTMNPALAVGNALMSEVMEEGMQNFIDTLNLEFSPAVRLQIINAIKNSDPTSMSEAESVAINAAARGWTNVRVTNFMESVGINVMPSGLTNRDFHYLEGVEGGQKFIRDAGAEKPSEEEFRFAGNFLVIINQVLALLNVLKIKTAQVDAAITRELADNEIKTAQSLIHLATVRMEKNIKERDKQRQMKTVKWIMFALTVIIQVVATVALSLIPGAGPVLISVMWAVTVTMITMQALDMAGHSVTKALCEAFGLDPEKYDWVMQLVVMAALVIFTLPAIAATAPATAARITTMSGQVATKTMVYATYGLEVGMHALMNANLIANITKEIAMAAGMSKEDAELLGMILQIVVMVVLAVVFIMHADKLMLGMGRMATQADKIKAAQKGADQANKVATKNVSKNLERFQKLSKKLKNLKEVGAPQDQIDQVQRQVKSIQNQMFNAAKKGNVAAKKLEMAELGIDPKMAKATLAAGQASKAQDSVEEGATSTSKAAGEEGASVTKSIKKLAKKIDGDMGHLMKQYRTSTDPVEKAKALEEVFERIQSYTTAIASIMQGVAAFYDAHLTKERAELKYDMAVIDAQMKKLQGALKSMGRELREALLNDMQGGINQLSTEMNNWYQKLITGLSQNLTSLMGALK